MQDTQPADPPESDDFGDLQDMQLADPSEVPPSPSAASSHIKPPGTTAPTSVPPPEMAHGPILGEPAGTFPTTACNQDAVMMTPSPPLVLVQPRDPPGLYTPITPMDSSQDVLPRDVQDVQSMDPPEVHSPSDTLEPLHLWDRCVYECVTPSPAH